MSALLLLAATAKPEEEAPDTRSGGLFEEEGGFGDEDWGEDFSVELPNELKTADDAMKTLVAIRGIAGKLKDLDSRDQNVQKACGDLQKAVGLLQAGNFEKGSSVVGNDEQELSRRYLREDGSLRLLSEESEFVYAGKTFRAELPGLLDDVDTTCRFQEDVKELVNQRQWARISQKNPSTPYLDAQLALNFSRAPTTGGFRKSLEEYTKKAFAAEAAAKKAFTNTSAVGGEWIPDSFVPDLYEATVVRGPVVESFSSIPVGSDSFVRPRVSNQLRLYIVNQISNDNPANFTASTPATGSQTYTVPQGAVRVLLDVAATEDSAISVIPVIQRLLNDTRNDAFSDAMLNGDTTATHQDTIATWNTRSRWGSTGLGGSADHRRIFKGVRRQSVDRSTTLDMGSLQTSAGLLQLQALMGERGAGQLRYFVSPEVMIQKLMALAEVITIDKMGPMATIVKGQLAALFGIPIIMTRWVSADLAATGLYTGSGSKSGVALVDVNAYYRYTRRGVMVEVQKIISNQSIELVLTIREGFDTPDESTAKNCAWGYNWL